MYKNRGSVFKGMALWVLAAGAFVGGTLALKNHEAIENYIEERVTPSNLKELKHYTGGWEPYTVTPEDGISPIWKLAKKCTREAGANSEHWRNEILEYNKSHGIDTNPVHLQDTIYMPTVCKCSEPNKK